MSKSLIFALASAASAVATASPVVAQQAQFSIPAGDLKGALDTLGRQSGKSVVYSREDVGGVRSAGFAGEASYALALKAVLAGSGFVPRVDRSAGIAIVRAQTVLAPIALASTSPDTTVADPGSDTSTGEIVVSGIRAGLQRAISVKRNADTVVDAVSAEDVGKFPDTNVAEAAQRITGVQITRVRGEGRQVNIRGLPANFAQVTLNGRELANATGDSLGSRAFDLSVLAPEFIRTLSVYKNSTADLTEGGLAGTVDVHTPHPLEIGKRLLSASISSEYESNSQKASPTGTAFFSNTYDDGRLGVSFGLSYFERRPSSQSASVSYIANTEAQGLGSASGAQDLDGDGVINPTQRVRIPSQTNYGLYKEKNRRISGVGSLQFNPSDKLALSIDGLYTRTEYHDTTSEFLEVFSNSSKLLSSKTINYQGLPTVTDFVVASTDTRGGSRYEDRQGSIYQIAGNANWQSNGWTAALDVAYSRSSQRFNNLNLADIANGQVEFSAQPGDRLFGIKFQNGFDAARLDPSSYRVASLNATNTTQAFNQISRDNLWELRADVKKDFGDYGLKSIRFGAHFTDRTIYAGGYMLSIPAAGVSALYASINNGVGLPKGPIAGSYSAAPFMVVIKPGNGNFLGTYNGSAGVPQSWLASDTPGLLSKFTDAELIAAAKNYAGGVYSFNTTGLVNVSERTWGGYGRADFAFGKLTGNVGFRIVYTEQGSQGYTPDLNGIQAYPEAGGTIVAPAAGLVSVDRNYWDFLPSFNLKYDATDRLVLRFAVSRTITRPTLTQVSPSNTVNNTTISGNNPYLNPYRATNIDLSAEWYFNREGLLGATIFYKNLDSLIVNSTVVETYPVTYNYASTNKTQIVQVNFNHNNLTNGGGVNLKGLELYYQQAFRFLPAPFDVLGTQLNYTFIDNSSPTRLTATARNNFNASVYYEKGQIGVRLSYAWRGSYLSSVATLPTLSSYSGSYGSLDASISWQLFRGIAATLNATNLLDSTEKSYYVGGLPASYIRNGKRITGGIRASF